MEPLGEIHTFPLRPGVSGWMDGGSGGERKGGRERGREGGRGEGGGEKEGEGQWLRISSSFFN